MLIFKMNLKKYLLFIIVLSTHTAWGSPAVRLHETTYPIYGSSTQELRQQMNHLGPRSQTAQYNASTVWEIKWRYKLNETANSCKISNADILVDIHYHFPEWKNYSSSESLLQNKWNLTIDKLRKHEYEHGNNGKRAAYAIENALAKLPSMADCQRLQIHLNKTASRIIQYYHQADLELDAVTRHGVV